MADYHWMSPGEWLEILYSRFAESLDSRSPRTHDGREKTGTRRDRLVGKRVDEAREISVQPTRNRQENVAVVHRCFRPRPGSYFTLPPPQPKDVTR